MTSPTMDRTTTGWTADASTFGARLALIRQRMGWGNVKEAALACGLPVETWRSWERDNREPMRLTTIARQIATTTGCSYEWLVLGPDRGDGGTATPGYLTQARLVATIGGPAGETPHLRQTARPVRRTRPAGRSRHPATPIAA